AARSRAQGGSHTGLGLLRGRPDQLRGSILLRQTRSDARYCARTSVRRSEGQSRKQCPPGDSLMRRSIILSTLAGLAACAIASGAGGQVATERVVNVYNWTDY